MIGLITLLAALAVIGLVPFWIERGRKSPRSLRKHAPGQFAKLSAGKTHYQWLGASHGPVIVCVHGLSTPSPVWYAIAAGLGKLGFRVLVYDLYGRGFSDAPYGRQTPSFFNTQLTDLLDTLKITEPVTVMGYSMGGAIVASFATEHTNRVRRVILLAAAGMVLREDRLTETVRKIPILGDWVFDVILSGKERKLVRKQLGQEFDVKDITKLQLSEYERRGFLRSMLSSRRHMLAKSFEEEHRTIANSDIPVVGIWGEEDDVIPLRSLGMLTQWNRNVWQEVISGHYATVFFDR